MPLTPGRSLVAPLPRLLGSLGVHPEDFPVVTVEVVEAPAVHEAVILRFGGVLPAGRDGLPDHLADLGPAVARQRKQSFGLPGRVAQLALGERLEEGLREKHHVRFLADDHAGRLVVRELRIELEAELGEELHRLLQVADGQVDEELPGTIGCHGSLLGLDLQFTARTGRTPRAARRATRDQPRGAPRRTRESSWGRGAGFEAWTAATDQNHRSLQKKIRRARRRCYAGRCRGNPKRGKSISVSRNEFHPAMRSPDSSSTMSAHGW